MTPQKIEEAAELLLQLKNTHNSQSEIGIMKNGIIVTIERLNRGNQYLINNGFNAKSLATVEKCKNNLQQRLINLEITPNSKITAYSLFPKLKDTIIAYYIQQGIAINEIIELIELIDNCDNNLQDALKIKFYHCKEYLHKKQKKEKLERYQQKHQHYLKCFRANGLELEKKHSLVIGSQIADKTGSYFNPHTTVFADLQYADLNGDILNTIDLLHSKIANYNKFKYIAFTHVPGLIFRSIDDTLSLMLKIYDILQLGGIVMISAGINSSCKKINSNKSFIDNILIPANFSENEIVVLNTHSIYKYEICLALLENNSHKLENSNNAITLIARKV